MENRAHALAAGLFTLVLGAALAIVALWFGKDELRLVPYLMHTTSSVTGLKLEAPVRYRGVDVGKVDEIAIDAASGGRVRIRIGVREGTPVTASTYAQLGYLGITGLAYVLLGDDGESREPLKSSAAQIAVIRMKPSMMDDGEGLFGSIIDMTAKLNALFSDENREHMRRTLAGLEQATQHANALATKLAPSLDAMPGLIAEAKNTAAGARASLTRADALIGSANGLALKLDQRVDTLTHALASVEEVGIAARTAGEETIPRLNLLAEDLSRESRTLGRVANTLGDHPQSIVFGMPPGIPGPGEPGFAGGR